MKRFIVFALLAVTFTMFSHAQAPFRNPDVAWGLSVGAAHGSNIGGDKWGMQYRANLQFNILSPMFIGQFGLGYAELYAPNVYSAQTGLADIRLLFSPFTLPNLNPYLYGGLGVTKCLNTSGSDFLPMLMVGAGIQSRIASGTMLNLDGGYNLSLSDEFDGRDRSTANLNAFTNQKQDGFFGFTVGLAFALGNETYTIE